MSEQHDGGPAFPTEANTQPGFYQHHGMSLRDWFAGQALAGFTGNGSVNVGSNGVGIELARAAYAFADAMLAERSK